MRALVFVLALLVSVSSWAGEDEWTSGANPPFANLAGANSYFRGVVEASDRTLCSSEFIWIDSSLPTLSVTIRVHNTPNGIGASPCSFHNDSTWSYEQVTSCPGDSEFELEAGECVYPPDCSAYVGRSVDRSWPDTGVGGAVCATPPASEGDELCGALVAEPSGVAFCTGGECYARLTFTGQQCGGEPDATGEELVDGPGDTNCVSGAGVTLCAKSSSQNCGTLNGQNLCVDSVPAGRCTFLGNGGMVCASDASAPPAPTESDGETPATADGTFNARGQDQSPVNLRYFGPGTVASSGTSTSGSGQSEFGTDEEGEDGEEEGCVGCELEVPEVEDGVPAGTVLTEAISAINAGGLGSVMSEIAVELPGGECPTASFDAWDQTFTFDSHCDFMESQRALLASIMVLVWALVAFKILMET